MINVKLGDVGSVAGRQVTVAAGDGSSTLRCACWNQELLRMDEVIASYDDFVPSGEFFLPVEVRIGDSVVLRSGSQEMMVISLKMSSFSLVVADLAVWDAATSRFKILHAGVDLLKRTA